MPTEPCPRKEGGRPRRKRAWAATGRVQVETRPFRCSKPFDAILNERRSSATIRDADLQDATAFIQTVFAPREVGREGLIGLLRKPMISAGALHPIDVLLVAGPDIGKPMLYCDVDDCWLTLPVECDRSLQQGIACARQVLPLADGHLLFLVGDRRRVDTKYEEPDSLLWRDAGAALQVCAMSAFAYGFRFCPIGILGAQILSALHPPHEDYVALGLGCFGR